MNSLSIVIYSHSDYSDLWNPCFQRLNKYFPYNRYILLTNTLIKELPIKNVDVITYDDSLDYNKRLTSILEKIDTEFILYLHEDMILYDNVQVPIIQNCVNILKNENYDFIRLIKSGIYSNLMYNDTIGIVNNSKDVAFSITPTIWKLNKFLEICNEIPPSTIWNFEVSGNEFVKARNISGLYVNDQLNKRGISHYDSIVFPHMCSAIFKGKWNMEYRNELEELFLEFGIDKNLRGIIF